MNKAPCQRPHGLRFEPRTAANRAVFKHKTTLTGQKEREQWRVSFQSFRAVIQYISFQKYPNLLGLSLVQHNLRGPRHR